MKKTSYILGLVFAGLLSLNSCQKLSIEYQYPSSTPLEEGNNVSFFGSISQFATRAGDTNWDTEDAIGVYAMISGNTLSQGVYDGKANIKYITTTGNEKFTAASTTNAIQFPQDGSSLDFVSYYPFKARVTNNTIPIDVTEQSIPAAIDLLYSNNSKDNASTANTVSLLFKHMLSKVMLRVKAENDNSLSGLSSSIENAIIDGSFNLETGVVSTGTTEKAITPKVQFYNNDTEAIVSAILMPGQSLADLNIKFTYNGKDYHWSPQGQDMNSSTKYSYDLRLEPNTGNVTSVKLTGTIEDWIDGNPGGTDVTINPDQQNAVFNVDKTSVSIEADSNLLQNINVTADTSQSWTVETSVTWLTLGKTSGTGSSNVSLTAEENTGAERTANVTFKADGQNDIVVTVTQAAGNSTPPSLTFTVNKTSVSLGANSNLSQTVNITTDVSQSWTVETSASWLTLSVTSGTGNGSVSLTAEENTGAERTANVTFKADGHADVAVSVTQEAGSFTPPSTSDNLFSGSDFEDWNAFTGSLNKYGVKHAVQSSNGRNSTKALHINDTPSKNDYVFTAEVPSGGGLTSKNNVVFYVKGEAAGKSLSVNIYKSTTDSRGYQEYYKFNIGDLGSSDVTIDSTTRNSYSGNINTQGNWVKVTLNISGLSDLATSGSLLAVKIGKGTAYNILIDDITAE